MTVVALALRLTLVFVLAAAVVGKLHSRASRADYRQMFTAMDVPAPLRAPVAVALVAAEIVTAPLLLVPSTVILGSAMAAALFGVLAAGVYHIVRGARRVRCNCFGGASGVELSALHVVRNVVLAVVALAALVLSFAVGAVATQGIAIAVAAALVLAAIVVRLDDLIYLTGWDFERR
ncbi:MauE/DoxX family redox-associated membrane protein [Micromonospora sp. NPDC048170]|uniref:MauE/DoxX family redox-associated membrane protein n=1 Tax=Micromonospora sp. NPDC048170 TaxID=3154819 RepID=UPI003402D8EC